MWQYRQSYPEVASSYGNRAMMMAGLARAGVDLDMPDAEAEVRRTLSEWPASPTPEQRRRLAALFAASGDPPLCAGAMVAARSRRACRRRQCDGALAEQFVAYETRRNESHLIAARLAARLGLERVYPVDDLPGPASRRISNPTLHRCMRPRAPSAGQFNADWQWLPMLNRPSPRHVGRRRVAAWEVRNLRMVANIREVSAHHPGGRVLVIVGASHKPWFDAYLRMMSDLRIVDAMAVLR